MDIAQIKAMGKRVLWFIADIIYNVGIVVVVVVILRVFIVSPFHVSGSSMYATLHNNDYILIDKLSYRFSEPEFGDVIVFTPPSPRMREVTGPRCFIAQVAAWDFSDSACILPDFFIKRIIGVAGDTIQIKEGEVYRNGELLTENYLAEENQHRTFIPEQDQDKTYVVPEGKFFVMGDNRTGSSDSRAHAKEWRDSQTGELVPFIQKEKISGKLLFILLSPYGIQSALAGN